MEPAPSSGVADVPRVAERVEAEGLGVAAAERGGRDARRVGGVLAVGQAVLQKGLIHKIQRHQIHTLLPILVSPGSFKDTTKRQNELFLRFV